MAILDKSAVVVLSGMLKSPIIPKPISAVIIMGIEPIIPTLTFLNIRESNIIMITSDIIKLII